MQLTTTILSALVILLPLPSIVIAAPTPEADALASPQRISPTLLNCYSTCSYSCVRAGNLQGGLCSSTGTCTCLTGVQAGKRDASPESSVEVEVEKREIEERNPQRLSSALINCYSTCSYGCVRAGNLQGGLCDGSGKCTCLTGVQAGKREATPEIEIKEREADVEERSPDLLSCYKDCSVGCVNSGHVRGGMCSGSG